MPLSLAGREAFESNGEFLLSIFKFHTRLVRLSLFRFLWSLPCNYILSVSRRTSDVVRRLEAIASQKFHLFSLSRHCSHPGYLLQASFRRATFQLRSSSSRACEFSCFLKKWRVRIQLSVIRSMKGRKLRKLKRREGENFSIELDKLELWNKLFHIIIVFREEFYKSTGLFSSDCED